MHVDLTDRAVLVTGASRGIGNAIARQMAVSGAKVAAHFYQSRDRAEALAETAPDRITVLEADLAEPKACDRLFDEAVERLGTIDVVVNNAGVAVSMPMRATLEEWERTWDLTIGVNLKAAERLCRKAILHFREEDGGRIINIASRAAFRGDTPEYMTYAASKGGLVAMTRSIARGFGKEGIYAFVVAPGFVRTDMAQDFINVYGEEYAMRGIATDRLTEPEDIAPTVVFLASGRADHATGTTVDINAASYMR